MKKEFIAASAVERLRLSEEKARARRGAEAEAVRVIARLEVEDETRRREDALRDAEINLARFGDVAEPIKRSWLAKVLRNVDVVVMGRSELEAVVAVCREQLERLRSVEGPERLRRADELSTLLLQGASTHAREGDVPRIAVVEAAPIGESSPTSAKSNGRTARSPFG